MRNDEDRKALSEIVDKADSLYNEVKHENAHIISNTFVDAIEAIEEVRKNFLVLARKFLEYEHEIDNI